MEGTSISSFAEVITPPCIFIAVADVKANEDIENDGG